MLKLDSTAALLALKKVLTPAALGSAADQSGQRGTLWSRMELIIAGQ